MTDKTRQDKNKTRKARMEERKSEGEKRKERKKNSYVTKNQHIGLHNNFLDIT